MALTTAERQKAYRLKHKNDLKRIDLLIKHEDASIFKAQVKKSGMTRAEYFKEMLNKEACYAGNLKTECTDDGLAELKAAHQEEIEGYKAELKIAIEREQHARKSRTDEQVRKDYSKSERENSKLIATNETLNEECVNLSKLYEAEKKSNTQLRKDYSRVERELAKKTSRGQELDKERQK